MFCDFLGYCFEWDKVELESARYLSTLVNPKLLFPVKMILNYVWTTIWSCWLIDNEFWEFKNFEILSYKRKKNNTHQLIWKNGSVWK